MAGPLDAVQAIHNAFREDLRRIDAAAADAARGKSGLAATVERFRFMNEVLVWHAHGEEIAVFPALEGVALLVAEAYLKDHRGLDRAFDALRDAASAKDAIGTARATAAFKFHLDIHLDKEDSHLYRIFGERVPMPEQGKAVGIMANQVPQDRFPELVAWLYPLMGDTDRENMTRIWKMVIPAAAFAGAAQLIQKAIPQGWTELNRRIPALVG